MRSLRTNTTPGAAFAAGAASSSPSRSFPRPRRPRIVAVAIRGILIAAVAAAGAIWFKVGVSLPVAVRWVDLVAVNSGLGIDQIAVTGSRNTLADDIFAALQLQQRSSLLSYDTVAARTRLEALSWIATAEVTRVMPNGLDVSLKERQPFAVWQHIQLLFLIDADGRTLEPTSRADHPDLPLVVGEGADAAARDAITLLQKFPRLAARMTAAVRVGGRRWDIRLKDAPTLMLPEDAPEIALAWVEQLDKDERLLDRRVAAIDLRVAGRVAFHLMSQPDGKSGAHNPAQATPAGDRGA